LYSRIHLAVYTLLDLIKITRDRKLQITTDVLSVFRGKKTLPDSEVFFTYTLCTSKKQNCLQYQFTLAYKYCVLYAYTRVMYIHIFYARNNFKRLCIF